MIMVVGEQKRAIRLAEGFTTAAYLLQHGTVIHRVHAHIPTYGELSHYRLRLGEAGCTTWKATADIKQRNNPQAPVTPPPSPLHLLADWKIMMTKKHQLLWGGRGWGEEDPLNQSARDNTKTDGRVDLI
jgi:hypothetical protein